MKILLLAKGYPPTIGGVENYSYYIAEGLGASHNVQVLTFNELNDRDNQESDKNAKVTRLHQSENELKNGWNMLRAIKKKLSGFSPDLVISTTWKVGLPFAYLKARYNIPLVLIAHGAEITRHRNHSVLMKLMRYVVRRADLIITVSDFTKEIIHKYTATSDDNVITVSNGINLESIKPVTLEEAREELGYHSDQVILLTVSRLDARKGHARVLRLLPEIKKIYPDLLYVIVGNGPERSELENLAASLNLTDKDVRFSGFVSDKKLPAYYSACDIFIMLNEMKSEEDFEGFGFVFAEAGAYCKPVIGGDNSGPVEVIDHNKTGFLVNPESSEEIVRTIIKLLDDHKKRKDMGLAAREKVMNKFTVDVMVSKLENELIQL